MFYSTEMRVQRLENRLNRLKMKPVENGNLIHKVKRQLRKFSVQ